MFCAYRDLPVTIVTPAAGLFCWLDLRQTIIVYLYLLVLFFFSYSVTRFLTLIIIHDSNPFGPVIYKLKYFRIYIVTVSRRYSHMHKNSVGSLTPQSFFMTLWSQKQKPSNKKDFKSPNFIYTIFKIRYHVNRGPTWVRLANKIGVKSCETVPFKSFRFS